MATAVTISIVVDSAQANAAIGALNKSLAEAGTSASLGFKQAGTAVQQLGGHTASSLDAVRLLSQEFGLRLPRAMEAMISRSAALSGAINSVVGGLALIAGIEVFAHLVKGAYDLYNNYISLNAAAEKYYETLKKTREADFGSARTVETQQQRFAQATQSYAQLHQQALDLNAKAKDEATNPNNMNPIAAGFDFAKAHDLETQAQNARKERDDSYKNGLDLLHQQFAAQIELNHAADAELVGRAKNNAEAVKKIALDAEDRRYAIEMEKAAGNPAAKSAGESEQRIKDATARGAASAQNVNLGREEALAIMKSQDEARQAGLEGDALYVDKRKDGIREITLQLQNQGRGEQQILAETAAFAAKLDNERQERLDKQWHDAQQAQRTAGQSGLTGAARVTADFGNRLDQINSDRSLDPAAAAQLRLAAKTEETQKLKQLSNDFTQTALANANTRTEAELGGFARIEAGATRATDALQKAYDAAYKDSDGHDLGTSAQRAALSSAKSGILADENAKKRQLTDANNAEDLQYAQEAAQAERRVKEDGILGWVASYKNGIAEINEEDARRTAKLVEQTEKQGLTEQEVAQRKIDIDRAANAQIEEQNLQLQHKLAGDLQAAFTNPVDFIKSAMQKMFFEILAGWLMRLNAFKTIFGSTLGGLQPGGAGGTAGASGGGIGGLLSTVHGAFNSGTSQGSYASSGGSAGGLSLPSGSTSSGGGGIESTIGDVGSLAHTASSIPGLSRAFGSSSSAGASGSSPGGSADASGLTYNDATGQFDPVADPTLSTNNIGLPGAASDAQAAGAATGAGIVGAGFGGYQLATNTANAFDTGNPLTGALGDAAAGAAIGSLAGPEGALIGAAAGAVIGGVAGLIGFFDGMGPKTKARNYYKQSIRPTLDAAAQNTDYGDFQSAIANVNKVSGDGLLYMKQHFGTGAGNWVNDHYMKKYVDKIDSMITSSASGGRQYAQLSASQFHAGGTITGFGSFATSPFEGFIHAAMGETVMTPGASAAHGSVLAAMNSGASAADVAGSYLGMGGRPSAAPSGSGGDTHFHVHTLDTKTLTGWLRGGGAKMITREQNFYNAQYAGDGIGG